MMIIIIISCCVWICSVGRLNHDLHIVVLSSLSVAGADHKEQNQFWEVVVTPEVSLKLKASSKMTHL